MAELRGRKALDPSVNSLTEDRLSWFTRSK